MSSASSLDLFLADPPEPTDMPPPATRTHIAKAARMEMMRAARTKDLRRTWPATLEDGVAYHWITAGDVDAGSFLTLAMDSVGHASRLAVSTWTMAREDVGLFVDYLDTNRVDHLTVLTGEYFAQRETAVYATLLQAMTARPHAHLRKLKNHTKLIVIDSAECAMVIATSANMTTNPRAEQHVLTVSRPLAEFYFSWFDEILASTEPAQ